MTLALNTNESPFDQIRHQDNQREYWLATELLLLLGYKSWRRQKETVERAIISCKNSGNDSDLHFTEVVQMAQIGGSQAYRSVVKDYKLSRLGCYLTAMNGDPRKPEIASAQSYFAGKAREAELREEARKPSVPVLPPAQQLTMAVHALKQLGVDFDNPRYSQGLKDWSLNLLGITPQPALSGDRWVGAAERAEELGFGRVGADLSKRVRLGQVVSKRELERRKEVRLVNGTNQGIWCYRICPELDQAISGFFGGES